MRHRIGRDVALATVADALVRMGTLDIEELRQDGFDGSTDAEVVRDWTNYRYVGATNQLLAELFELVSGERVIVDGRPDMLHPCPCCGLRTLTEPGGYDICRWCGWEDDGNPDVARQSSVNAGESILDVRARLSHDRRLRPFGRWISGFEVADPDLEQTNSVTPDSTYPDSS